MGGFLTDDDLNALRPADEVMFPSPIPTQVISSDEFWPSPQTERQKQVETRIKAMADDYGAKQGLDRRRFLQTASGMAAAFLAMNEVYGPLYTVSRAEAQQAQAALKLIDEEVGSVLGSGHGRVQANRLGSHEVVPDAVLNFVRVENLVKAASRAAADGGHGQRARERGVDWDEGRDCLHRGDVHTASDGGPLG